jgi:hypothetical protein
MEEVHLPYDNQWEYLKRKGIKVRVMFPNLFMPGLRDKSASSPRKEYSDATVEARLVAHKWEPKMYCESHP